MVVVSATNAGSVANLAKWFDEIMRTITNDNVYATTLGGNRIPIVYKRVPFRRAIQA